LVELATSGFAENYSDVRWARLGQGSTEPPLLQEQISVAATAIREFVEELYGVHELETGDGRVDPNARELGAADL
jgi:hypothetical protein